jgi:asparagine synthase (glutamine-hydrolysing)
VRHKLRKSFFAVEPNIENIYFDNFAVFPRKMQSEMFTDETKSAIGSHANPYAEMSRFFDSAETKSLLDRMLYADTKTYLHELLMKQDQMSMAASIESRVPFLDHKLMEFSAQMPDNMKLRGQTTKFVLREAMKGILPDEILTRPKMGFPVPIGKWFRNEYKHLIDEYVLSERALARGIFKADFVRNLVERHHIKAKITTKDYGLCSILKCGSADLSKETLKSRQ